MKYLVLLLLLATAQAYHILCVFPVPSHSHNYLGRGVVNALLNAGHEVTWATPYPPKELPKGLKIIDVSATVVLSEMANMNDQRNADAGLSFVKTFATNITKMALSVPALKQAIVKGGYDAVLTEAFFNDAEAGFGAVLQVPWILLSSISMMPRMESQVDEVRTVTTVPLLFNDAAIPMSIVDRVKNLFMYAVMTVGDWLSYAETVSLYESLFKPLADAKGITLPPFSGAYHNLSILFVNSNPAFAPASVKPANVIEIGGYHIDPETPPLPKDLQQILDASPQGVVYFSMGSVLKSSRLAEQTKKDILKVFGSLRQTVLWKFEEKFEGLPKNVHVRPWMPQASILAHPNVKVFITHGGLLSTFESLHYGVPILAIPVFGDQPSNAAMAVKNGFARKIQYKPDMATDIGANLDVMLKDDSYYKRAKYLSSIFGNSPIAPTKLIPHYVEVAIETKGAYHLRSKSLLYAWYERWCLDIIAVFLLALLLAYSIIRKTICFVYRSVTGKTCGKKIKAKKN